jgi:hypothetical protein
MSTERRPEGRIGRVRGDVGKAADEVRAVLAKRVAEIDPDLLVDLTVGVRSRTTPAEASWTDSWVDRFRDNGKFTDMWINLSGLRDREGEVASGRPPALEGSSGPVE